MIFEVAYFEGWCDNCGAQWDDDYFALKDPDAVEFSMEEQEWHIDEDKHYCPDCWEVGDNDEIIIKSKKQ